MDLDALLDIAADATGTVGRAISELAIRVGGFEVFNPTPSSAFVALPDELNEQQRAIAERLADTMLLPIAAFGLPACGAPRRRWLGKAEPGPAEGGGS